MSDRKGYPPQEEPTKGPELGCVGDIILWEEKWGRIVKRLDGSYYVIGYKNGFRVLGTSAFWTGARSVFMGQHRRAMKSEKGVGSVYRPSKRGTK